MYRRRSPRRGDCPLALCCMAFGLGVLLALCGELRTALVFAAIGLVNRSCPDPRPLSGGFLF